MNAYPRIPTLTPREAALQFIRNVVHGTNRRYYGEEVTKWSEGDDWNGETTAMTQNESPFGDR